MLLGSATAQWNRGCSCASDQRGGHPKAFVTPSDALTVLPLCTKTHLQKPTVAKRDPCFMELNTTV